MCRVKYERRAGIEFLTRADGGESYKFGADVDAVRAGMIMSADDELYHSPALVSDDRKHLVGVVYYMSFLDSDIEALMAKDPEAAALGGIHKDLAQSFDLVGWDISILPVVTCTAAVACAVRAVIRVKEDEIDFIRAADKGRADKIRDAVKGIVVKIFEIVIALHYEDRHRAVADDFRHARKMLDVVRTADASVYHVAKADGEINTYIFKVKKKLLQLSKRARGITVPVRDLFPSAMKVGKKSNFHIFSPYVD